jgi:hypothetical protein
MAEAIVDLLKRGNYISTAARAVGINPVTIGAWVRKGHELSEVDRELDETEQMFVDFAVEVEKARAFAEVSHVETIRQASKDNWTASAWWLERSNPNNWGRVQRTEITGAGGGAIEIDVESVNRKIEALLSRQIIDVTAVITESTGVEQDAQSAIQAARAEIAAREEPEV